MFWHIFFPYALLPRLTQKSTVGWPEVVCALTQFAAKWCPLTWQMAPCLSSVAPGTKLTTSNGGIQWLQSTGSSFTWPQSLASEIAGRRARWGEPWRCDLEGRSMRTVLRRVLTLQEWGFRRQAHAHCGEKCVHTSGGWIFQMADKMLEGTEKSTRDFV